MHVMPMELGDGPALRSCSTTMCGVSAGTDVMLAVTAPLPPAPLPEATPQSTALSGCIDLVLRYSKLLQQ